MGLKLPTVEADKSHSSSFWESVHGDESKEFGITFSQAKHFVATPQCPYQICLMMFS